MALVTKNFRVSTKGAPSQNKLSRGVSSRGGHEATDTGLAYAPVSQACPLVGGGGTMRKAEAPQQGKEAVVRQRERRPRGEDLGDATQRTQLAQAPPKHSYAAAAQSSARKGRTHTVVVAKREPQSTGIPLKPAAEELQRTAEKGGYGAVVLARPYSHRDLADTGMTQVAPASPPAQWPSSLKKVLLVGRNTEDAWAVALEALAAHKGLYKVAAIVNVGRLAAAPG